MGEMDESMLRALGIAIQILGEMPDHLRPESDISEMREIMAGKSTGRDFFIVTQAVATALAYRAMNAMRAKRGDLRRPEVRAGLENRVREFGNLFELATRCNASLLGQCFDEACGNLIPEP